jgi:glutamyl-tRNA reductase
MQIIQVGLDHKTAPVEIREQLAFSETQTPTALNLLCSCNGSGPSAGAAYALEGAILSTCNRTEIYAVVTDAQCGQQKIKDYLSLVSGVPREVLAPYLQLRQGQEAGAHLCQVACGLDSMILGEPQIQGQVVAAYQLAMTHHSAGAVLNALFRAALHSGKRARTETAISKHATSISHAAVELASQIFDDLAQKCILLIGAGEMAELAAKNLVDNGVANLLVVNRSPERAASLAQKFGGETIKWERLTQALCQADIVISSTAAPQAILTRENVATAMHVRRNRPLFLIDIAVPRDIEPAVGELSNAFVYDIDDLQQVVQANLEQRQREIPRVQAIVEDEMNAFMAWFRALDVVPTIVDLRQHAERVRQAELERAMRQLEHLSDQEQKVIATLSRRIINKILHQPTTRLKQHANDSQAYPYVAAIRDLFELSAECAPEEKEQAHD